MIWRLSITRTRRYGLMALFSLGLMFVTILFSLKCSIANSFVSRSITADLINVLISDGVFPPGPKLRSYDGIVAPVIYGLPILVACACTFKPLLDKAVRVCKSITNTYSSSSNHTATYDGQMVETIGRARNHHRRNDLEDALNSQDGDFSDRVDSKMDKTSMMDWSESSGSRRPTAY